jgi:hypothetical protein
VNAVSVRLQEIPLEVNAARPGNRIHSSHHLGCTYSQSLSFLTRLLRVKKQ